MYNIILKWNTFKWTPLEFIQYEYQLLFLRFIGSKKEHLESGVLGIDSIDSGIFDLKYTKLVWLYS